MRIGIYWGNWGRGGMISYKIGHEDFFATCLEFLEPLFFVKFSPETWEREEEIELPPVLFDLCFGPGEGPVAFKDGEGNECGERPWLFDEVLIEDDSAMIGSLYVLY